MFYPQGWFSSTSKREVRSLQSQPNETPDVDVLFLALQEGNTVYGN